MSQIEGPYAQIQKATATLQKASVVVMVKFLVQNGKGKGCVAGTCGSHTTLLISREIAYGSPY